MAGMDWFRWHHGSVTDPKFQLVAKKAGASVAEVLAVWACLLEAASQAENRGNPGGIDHEAMDCALGLADGKTMTIHQEMKTRGLFTAIGRVAGWQDIEGACGERLPEQLFAILRSAVFARDNWTCRYCGARGVRMECDHVEPIARGGSNAIENLATACVRCNRSKGSKTLEAWGARNGW